MFGQLKPNNRLILAAAVLLAVFLFPDASLAHPGRTAADGCHYCRTNCDKWGVAWNQRHCHGGSTTPAPDPTPTPAPAPKTKPAEPAPTTTEDTKTDTSVDGRVKEKINSVKNDYPEHHQGFRESLIGDIVNMLGNDSDINKINNYVYTMLPDIKVGSIDPGKYTCDCGKTCPNISTCEEAYYQLNNCGCSVRDGDNDGIPCEEICH